MIINNIYYKFLKEITFVDIGLKTFLSKLSISLNPLIFVWCPKLKNRCFIYFHFYFYVFKTFIHQQSWTSLSFNLVMSKNYLQIYKKERDTHYKTKDVFYFTQLINKLDRKEISKKGYIKRSIWNYLQLYFSLWFSKNS